MFVNIFTYINIIKLIGTKKKIVLPLLGTTFYMADNPSI